MVIIQVGLWGYIFILPYQSPGKKGKGFWGGAALGEVSDLYLYVLTERYLYGLMKLWWESDESIEN